MGEKRIYKILLFIKIFIGYNLRTGFSVIVTKDACNPYTYNQSEI